MLLIFVIQSYTISCMRKSKKINKLNIISKRRLIACLILCFLLFIYLVFRLAWIQFVGVIQGHDLKEAAYRQHVTSRTITAKRGTIYDASDKALALSADIDSVTVNMSNLKTSDGSSVPAKDVAETFSNIFKLDYKKTLKKLKSNPSNLQLVDVANKSQINNLKEWMKDNKISTGITTQNYTKRFYPYDNLASNLLGFTGKDHQGLFGLENSFEDILAGENGKVVITTDSVNGEIPNSEQMNMAAKDGDDITLTIDVRIQSVAEKHLKQAVSYNKAEGRKCYYYEPSNRRYSSNGNVS